MSAARKLSIVVLASLAWAAGNSCTHNNHANTNATEWHLRTDDNAADLYVYEFGQGKPIVVLHGGPGGEHSYLLDALKGLEKAYHFILYDQRGSLRSPCGTELISADKHIRDLETLREKLGFKRVTLFGHSWGAHLALLYLQRFPDHVENLVLSGALPLRSRRYLSPSLRSSMEEAFAAWQRFAERPEKYAELEKADYNSPNPTAKQMAYIEKINHAARSIYHIDRWQQLKGFAFLNEEATAATQNSLPVDYDFTQIIIDHPHPITVINGDHDGIDFNGLFYKEFSGEAAKIELAILENAGHVSWIDAPDEFRKALSKGLSRAKQD